MLRESGLILSERQGVEMRNQTRWTELEKRFPGLIKPILTAYGQLPGQPKTDWSPLEQHDPQWPLPAELRLEQILRSMNRL